MRGVRLPLRFLTAGLVRICHIVIFGKMLIDGHCFRRSHSPDQRYRTDAPATGSFIPSATLACLSCLNTSKLSYQSNLFC